MLSISRRHFLRRLGALAAGAAGLRVLAACTPAPGASPSEAPIDTVVVPSETPTLAATPTATSTPEGLPAPPPRPDIIRFHPDAPSTVVHARHQGVWQGEDLVAGAVRQMLDASITALTGLDDAGAAWAALFRPNERVAIKVNAFQNSLLWTHVPLVTAVTDSLQQAGIPAEQITLYDWKTYELREAGFELNDGQSASGVRCYGTDDAERTMVRVAVRDVKLSNVILGCDALINMPILKSHALSGFTYAMKNHYGSVERPDLLHSQIGRCIAELNALPEIKDRTRLIIGDALEMVLQEAGSWPYWRDITPGDSILVSYDPVALDTVALRLLGEAMTAHEIDPASAQGKAGAWLRLAAELGVGTDDEKNMAVKELTLG